MTIKLYDEVPVSPWKYAAIISLDPASVGPCGIACRATAGLPATPSLDKLRAPDFIYEGAVFNDVMLDELTTWCARNVGGQSVLLAAEATAYGSMAIARSLGRAVGAVEVVLYYCGFLDPGKTVKLQARTWRKAAGMPDVSGRDAQKAAAIALVDQRYKLTLGSDAAEAVLQNDAVVMNTALWQGKRRSKK